MPFPVIADWIAQAEGQKREVGELVDGLTEAQLNWRPAQDRWSIGEHLAHLPLATRPYIEAIDAAVAAARAGGVLAEPPYRYRRIGTWFARNMEPPPRMRIKTLRALVPTPPRSKAEVVATFAASQDDVIRSLHAATGVDLGRATMRSPFMKLLRLSLGSAYQTILAHNRRHLWHARRVLEHPALPRP